MCSERSEIPAEAVAGVRSGGGAKASGHNCGQWRLIRVELVGERAEDGVESLTGHGAGPKGWC